MDGNAMINRHDAYALPTPALAQEVERFDAVLADVPNVNESIGHRDLISGLWISTEPGSNAAFSCRPAELGLHLSLERGDSSGWATLGCQIGLDALRQGRYLGLMTSGHAHGFVSFRAAIRWYWPEGGCQDVFNRDFTLLSGGPFEKLVHMPIDSEAVHRCDKAELNIFFQCDQFSVDFYTIEPLLIS